MKPKILVLHATGSNRDRDVAWAGELAGGDSEIIHVNQLIAGERRLLDYQMLVLPGGFSYGDDLGAGKLWAVILSHRLADDLAAFVAAKRPILGICNGFQALVKAGLLPGGGGPSHPSLAAATLTRNDSAQFECRWVYLQPQTGSPCVFTRGLAEPIYCPVAHGEGKFVTRDAQTLAQLEARGGVALRYVDETGLPAEYPWNPNGSQAHIAGVCDPTGTILGLMPHPEDHLIAPQHPQFHRGRRGWLGLPLFQNGVRYAASL
jgi:phosphoribosylformylglycinamidine synthase subunit PurQ / glutaminase